MSLTVEPAEIPRICVCTAPDTPTVHKSDVELLMLGEIADGGGDITVVVESLVEVTVLVVVFSVTIGSTSEVVVVVVSSCAYAAVAKNNITKAANIFLIMVFALDYELSFIYTKKVDKQDWLIYNTLLTWYKENTMAVKGVKQGHSSAHIRTSIGKSPNSKPKNKHKRRPWKAYNKQGK